MELGWQEDKRVGVLVVWVESLKSMIHYDDEETKRACILDVDGGGSDARLIEEKALV